MKFTQSESEIRADLEALEALRGSGDYSGKRGRKRLAKLIQKCERLQNLQIRLQFFLSLTAELVPAIKQLGITVSFDPNRRIAQFFRTLKKFQASIRSDFPGLQVSFADLSDLYADGTHERVVYLLELMQKIALRLIRDCVRAGIRRRNKHLILWHRFVAHSSSLRNVIRLSKKGFDFSTALEY